MIIDKYRYNGRNLKLFMKPGARIPRIALATLGCKVNQYESAALAEILENMGFAIAPFDEDADGYIVNTCTVTSRTDFQCRQLIRRAVRRNPGAFVVVTGCYAQVNAAELEGIPGVTVVAGNLDKETIPRIVADLWTEEQDGGQGVVAKRRHVRCFGQRDPFYAPEVKRLPDHTRLFLKIQDGCDGGCSYCIVPRARGRSRSLPPEEVLRRISRSAAAGCQEIVLTGIHLGCYGQDLNPRAGLAAILGQIETRKSIGRLRISSIEPREVTDELLALFKESTIICPHLHIPLQSGDDAILALMNRDYDAAFFGALVEKAVAARPDTAIGLDVMAGFPGEDEAAFERTYRLIEELPVAYLHVFPYSKRPGTKASGMPGQVREEDKKRRAERLRSLGREKKRVFMERFIGQPLQVLLEGRIDKRTGYYRGFSKNYIPVTVVDGAPERVNTVVTVLVDRPDAGGMIGGVVHER